MTASVLHTADLHLSQSDRAYGLAVLDELIAHALRLRPNLVLLAGDIFDSHADALALAEAFADRVRRLGDTPVLMTPGNHELLGAPQEPPDALGPLAEALGGAVRLLLVRPFAHAAFPALNLEVLGVPFRRDFAGYLDWAVPPRQARFRLGMLHGVVNGMSYTGDSDEAEHAVIDPHVLERLGLDYAALGHIHRRGEARLGTCLAHYPGSARVWRKGESGARQASLVTLDEHDIRVTPVPLRQAGTYREAVLALAPDGSPAQHGTPESWVAALADGNGTDSAADWVTVRLEGFVESSAALLPLREALQRIGAARFRRFELDRSGIVAAERLAGHPMVRAFDALWRQRFAEAAGQGDERRQRLLLRARELALAELLAHLSGT